MKEKEPIKKIFDLDAIRKKLSEVFGRQYWRSLEELAETDGFKAFLENEFPEQARALPDGFTRREFLKLMGASLMLAGLGGCSRQPSEKIVPYVKAPEQIIPGKPLFFATAMPFGGTGHGILVESHLGRPTKIEGNPQHPESLGATDIFAQASILTLYDPDRSQVVVHEGKISTWDSFLNAMRIEMASQRLKKGSGLRILTETITSPTLADQIKKLLKELPLARWHQYDALSRDHVRKGSMIAFGEYVNTIYKIDQADVILSLDADFLFSGPGSLRYIRDFSSKRNPRENSKKMNRLYMIEGTPSLTGSMADHRLMLKPSLIEKVTYALCSRLGINIRSNPDDGLTSLEKKWMDAVAKDLKNHSGRCLVLAGDDQSPMVHALSHALNQTLGNINRTVVYTDPVEAEPTDQMTSLRELIKEMKEGKVETLIILGGNPVYTAPVDLSFSEHFSKIKLRIHLGLYEDETSVLSHWHIPEAHYLESWGDIKAYDGTVSLLQPLIEPLYDGKSSYDLMGVLLDQTASSYNIVQDYWKKNGPSLNFENFWQTSLHDGFISNSALPPKSFTLKNNFDINIPPLSNRQSLEIIFKPDPTVWDGQFSNNGWLQELPKPLSKLTWDNAALMSPATAQRLGVQNEELIELNLKGFKQKAPVWILPGHVDHAITLHLGYGRTNAGRVGKGTGFNAYLLRTSESPSFSSGLEIQKTGRRYALVSTQHHHSMEGRELVRAGSLEEYHKDPEFVHHQGHEPSPEESFYPPHKYEGYAWGMTIDLNACVGCNACVIACQSENNIPIVGKKEVGRGREMHWIRLDRYYEGNLDQPQTYHQPVLCMHCENAPCEPVCPVGATIHDKEGLNVMVYNRCVGTKYCSNNCPYKVRRFNFFEYADHHTESLKPLRNPDVTVRARGVMEKCTYCVQRINVARIQAKKEDREIRDGEVVTACQAVCPAQAIVFGDINDSKSRVAKLKKDPLNYGILTDLNTRPRTTYLARLRNPNPEVMSLEPLLERNKV
jgi:molybdopterin-containing oxidoreductase family iron-sulfur binding subunit